MTEPTRILKQPEYKVVQRGMNAYFECKVKHDPSLIPTMTWLKDNGELPDDEKYDIFKLESDFSISCGLKTKTWHTNSVIRFEVDTDSLVIKDVTDEDEGTYTCIMNTTLDQDFASAMLTVVGTFARYVQELSERWQANPTDDSFFLSCFQFRIHVILKPLFCSLLCIEVKTVVRSIINISLLLCCF